MHGEWMPCIVRAALNPPMKQSVTEHFLRYRCDMRRLQSPRAARQPLNSSMGRDGSGAGPPVRDRRSSLPCA